MISNESLVGREIGPFRIAAEIGHGGMGVVYRAVQVGLGREVALKVLPGWLAGQPGFSDRFLSEARSAARLHHPSIVTIHDVGEVDGTRYIVMELLRGRTLEDVLRQDGPLPPARALRIAEQLASALDYAHSAGVVHRDVKPANVVVGEDDRATLTDFGIARVAEGTIQQTMTGTVLGTPEYMAPEQAEGRPVTSMADQYALACVLYELLAGHPPFQADTPMGVILHQVRTAPPQHGMSSRGYPAALDNVLGRALAKNPAARFDSCGQFVAAAAAAIANRVSPTAVRRGRSLAIAAAAALGAVALMGLLLSSAGASPRSSSEPLPTPTQAETTAPALAATVAPTTAPPPTATVAPTSAPPPTATPAPTTPPTAVPTSTAVAPPQAPAIPTPWLAPPAVPSTGQSAPTGSLVLVRSNGSRGNDLFRYDLKSGAMVRLTNSGATWNWAPAVSADGQWLAFETGSPGAADVAIMRIDGSGRSVVARSSSSLNLGAPWWKPDSRIAFGGTSHGLSEIYTVSRAGDTPVQLTETPGIDGTNLPTWPRNGGPLVVTGKQQGLLRIFEQTPRGGFLPISPDGVEAYAPAWAPDGNRVAFQTNGSGPLATIATVGADGLNTRRLVAAPAGAWVRAPAWSSDGRWIAYVSSQAASAGADYGDLFIVPADGGQPRQLTSDGQTYDWRIAWLP